MAKASEKYEVMYIINPNLTEEETAAVVEKFNATPNAAKLKATGVVLSYICPLMYMNNPMCAKMPVITNSNKLRTYTTSRYYSDSEILDQITGGAK